MKVKYCVASVYVDLANTHVRYYAYQKNVYGLHLVSDWRDKNVLWYDTLEDAKNHIHNAEGECVLSFCIDYIPKFNK